MSYTVLARKYRSRTLDEIIGQEPIVTTLTNAINSGRIHHAFLFCGTRGVGKTSTARVLAKSLNCLSVDAPTPTPCGKCDSCEAIALGQDIDVIEIDAASNTGVDHIRELRSNASYRPARARYKIYIIDEVHMLSTGAFNALLKTLEEPPEHVKFIFATTELQKVPATIQSRVQRFEFQSIPLDKIVEQFKMILKAEEIEADEAVIRRVARCANGSMRDGLSLLDQLLSLGMDRLDAQMMDDILPAQHDEQLAQLIDHIADSDAAAALDMVERYLAGGRTLERFCETMTEHLRALMLICVCGPESDLVDVPVSVRDQVIAQSKSFDAQTYVYMITIMEELRRQVRSSGAGRALIDAAVVRLACAHNFTAIPKLLGELGGAETGAIKKKVDSPAGTREREMPARSTAGGSSAAAQTRQAARPGTRPADATGPGRSRGPGTRAAGRKNVTSEDLASARSDPLVRAALELFDGKLINVQKIAAAVPETPAAEPAKKNEGE
ncbi:MAG: DNA polymerase III subunit gamma/tau [Planctomycetes bacterium]|nr:DNA polymerase III subunit gamma/tau [Planctomycetota bacterium]